MVVVVVGFGHDKVRAERHGTLGERACPLVVVVCKRLGSLFAK